MCVFIAESYSGHSSECGTPYITTLFRSLVYNYSVNFPPYPPRNMDSDPWPPCIGSGNMYPAFFPTGFFPGLRVRLGGLSCCVISHCNYVTIYERTDIELVLL